MTYEFYPRGVCSRKMVFEIENGVVKDLEVVGGCNGNLNGIPCGNKPTSCPDQIASGLKKFLEENK